MFPDAPDALGRARFLGALWALERPHPELARRRVADPDANGLLDGLRRGEAEGDPVRWAVRERAAACARIALLRDWTDLVRAVRAMGEQPGTADDHPFVALVEAARRGEWEPEDRPDPRALYGIAGAASACAGVGLGVLAAVVAERAPNPQAWAAGHLAREAAERALETLVLWLSEAAEPPGETPESRAVVQGKGTAPARIERIETDTHGADLVCRSEYRAERVWQGFSRVEDDLGHRYLCHLPHIMAARSWGQAPGGELEQRWRILPAPDPGASLLRLTSAGYAGVVTGDGPPRMFTEADGTVMTVRL